MPYKVNYSELNASTVDILNVIRANASTDYQSSVPEIAQAREIVHVGQSIMGEASLLNEFVNALVNRIALVRIRSAIFYNPYADLKKGVLALGETVEEVYVSMAKAMCFSADKAEKRDLKRYVPDVKAAFHAINWRVIYPISIERADIEKAFLSPDGVTDFIMRLMESVYTGASYDEYLLFKYLIIKGVNNGKFAVLGIDDSDTKNSGVVFRGTSNMLTFVSNKYNERGVQTATPREDQHIFMDAKFNAQFDVDVLSAAFNMDKADFMGRLHLIDDFTSFDNDRFDIIRKECDGLEEVTAAELAALANVKAILVDSEWFQIYDTLENGAIMTSKEVASGLRWNYFLHVWKTVSTSPFSNAIAFKSGNGVQNFANSGVDAVNVAESYNVKIASKVEGENAVVYTLEFDNPMGVNTFEFKPGEGYENKIAVQKYGAIIFPKYALDGGNVVASADIILDVCGVEFNGTLANTAKPGDTIAFEKAE